MQNSCNVCHKNTATIHILDLDSGKVIDEQSLCAVCAESAGYVHAKSSALPLKISPEMLEELIGGMKPSTSEPKGAGAACPACGLTASQFRSRGRLGCSRCYEAFRQSLVPLLERVHDGTSHRGRCPGRAAKLAGEDDRLSDLRSSLRDAVQEENYELAASLRDQIQALSPGEEPAN